MFSVARPIIDLTGRKFGYLTVMHREGTAKNKVSTWRCICVCGEQVVRLSTSLRSKNRGKLKSCGCRRREMLLEAWGTHGMTGTRPWVIWQDLRRRCRDPKDKDYVNYGGRGIDMPGAWFISFRDFWEDVKVGYQDDLSLDRRDNEAGYSKSNCRWVSMKVQMRNTRVNRLINTKWGLITVAEAAERSGLKPITVYGRMYRGWPEERLLEPLARRSRFTT